MEITGIGGLFVGHWLSDLTRRIATARRWVHGTRRVAAAMHEHLSVGCTRFAFILAAKHSSDHRIINGHAGLGDNPQTPLYPARTGNRNSRQTDEDAVRPQPVSRNRFLPMFTLVAMIALAPSVFADRIGPEAIARGDTAYEQQLAENVAEMLTAKENVSVVGLVVNVEGGVVTLEGRVATSAEKHLASRYSQQVKGVQGIVNAIIVKPILE